MLTRLRRELDVATATNEALKEELATAQDAAEQNRVQRDADVAAHKDTTSALQERVRALELAQRRATLAAEEERDRAAAEMSSLQSETRRACEGKNIAPRCALCSQVRVCCRECAPSGATGGSKSGPRGRACRAGTCAQ